MRLRLAIILEGFSTVEASLTGLPVKIRAVKAGFFSQWGEQMWRIVGGSGGRTELSLAAGEPESDPIPAGKRPWASTIAMKIGIVEP